METEINGPQKNTKSLQNKFRFYNLNRIGFVPPGTVFEDENFNLEQDFSIYLGMYVNKFDDMMNACYGQELYEEEIHRDIYGEKMQAARAVGDHGKCLDLELLKKKFIEENKIINLEGYYTVVDAEGKSMKLVAPEDFNPKLKISF